MAISIIGRLLSSTADTANIDLEVYEGGAVIADNLLETTQTDDTSEFRLINVDIGDDEEVNEPPLVFWLPALNIIPDRLSTHWDNISSTLQVTLNIPPALQPNFQNEIRDALVDMTAYMPTSHEATGSAHGSITSTTGKRRQGSLDNVIDGAMVELLGQRLKYDDPKAVLASLNRAVSFVEVDGKRQPVWTQRTYAVETELGAELTGAQASLYHQFKYLLDDLLKKLNALRPLDTAPDAENMSAIREIFRNHVMQLVEEIGLEGGPRRARVDEYFIHLHERLALLQNTFGLTLNEVRTVDEERVYTDFLIIQQHVTTMQTAWTNFTNNNNRYLGTDLVQLSRIFSVVAEGVDEAYRAMDAVALGAAERQTILLFATTPTEITLANLLSWMQEFATQEGPDLARHGGVAGVQSIAQIANHLQGLVARATQPAATQNPHIGFSRPRVRRTLAELDDHLWNLANTADRLYTAFVPPPQPPVVPPLPLRQFQPIRRTPR